MVRFLADESCDYVVVRTLIGLGHEVLAVADLSPRADDESVIDLALRERCVLLTEDKDFGQLVHASGLDSTGVVLLRFPAGSRSGIGIDLRRCPRCGVAVRVLAVITAPPADEPTGVSGRRTRSSKTMLTPTQLEQYREDGFVVPDYRLPDGTVEAIRADHDRLLASHPEFVNYCPNVLAFDLAFLNHARIPAVLDMVEQVLGPDFALWNSSFFAKPAVNGYATPWHQDGEYWPIRPLATCTVWIAVDDATRDNGCLRFIPGSHRSARLLSHRTNSSPDLTLNQELLESEFDESEAVDLVLEAGRISLHDVFLTHGSEPNRSPHPRRGMTLRYMPTTSVFDRDLARRLADEKGIMDHTRRTLFLMRGGDPSGRNDFRLRW